MAKLITLANLQKFSTELKAKYATLTALEALQTKVNALVTAGGEPNVLEGVKVNGVALAIADKLVDIVIKSGVDAEGAAVNGTINVNGANIAVAGL